MRTIIFCNYFLIYALDQPNFTKGGLFLPSIARELGYTGALLDLLLIV